MHRGTCSRLWYKWIKRPNGIGHLDPGLLPTQYVQTSLQTSNAYAYVSATSMNVR